MPQAEVELIHGSGSLSLLCGLDPEDPCHRWGDYTAMTVDPVDDCTFWYTNQYFSSPATTVCGDKHETSLVKRRYEDDDFERE